MSFTWIRKIIKIHLHKRALTRWQTNHKEKSRHRPLRPIYCTSYGTFSCKSNLHHCFLYLQKCSYVLQVKKMYLKKKQKCNNEEIFRKSEFYFYYVLCQWWMSAFPPVQPFYYPLISVLTWLILVTVPLVQAELVPICTKLHFMVGQRVRICAHEGPLCACYTVVHLWENVFQYQNILLLYLYFSMWSCTLQFP